MVRRRRDKIRACGDGVVRVGACVRVEWVFGVCGKVEDDFNVILKVWRQ